MPAQLLLEKEIHVVGSLKLEQMSRGQAFVYSDRNTDRGLC